MKDVRIGSDGILRVDNVTYNYVQTKNLVPDGCFGYTVRYQGNPSSSSWDFKNCSLINGVKGEDCKTRQYIRINKCESLMGMVTTLSGSIETKKGWASQLSLDHIYYAGLLYNTDRKVTKNFEETLVFSLRNESGFNRTLCELSEPTVGEWKKVSNVFSSDRLSVGNHYLSIAPSEGGSKMSTDVNISNLILIDLTDAFGADNEPDKEWCDENILEWNKYVNIQELWKANESWFADNDHLTSFTGNSYKYEAYPTEYYYENSNADGNPIYFITSSSSYGNTVESPLYVSYDYKFMDNYDALDGEYVTLDWNFIKSDKIVGSVVKRGCSTGDMKDWGRRGWYASSNTTFSDWTVSFRYMEFEASFKEAISNIGCSRVDKLVSEYNACNGTGITINDVNREWCDRWVDHRSHSIIHILDPKKKDIKIDFAVKNGNSVIGDFIPKNYNSSEFYTMLGHESIFAIDNLNPSVEFGAKYWVDITVDDVPKVLALTIYKADESTVKVLYLNCYDPEKNPFLKIYNINCNDIEIRPEVDGVEFLPNGKIICRGLKFESTQYFYKKGGDPLTTRWVISPLRGVDTSDYVEIKKFIYNERDRFLGVRSDFSLIGSSDGYSWDVKVESLRQVFNVLNEDTCTGICYGNGKYVIVTSNGNILCNSSSPWEYSSWSLLSTVENTSFTSICYGNGKFIAVTKQGDIYSMEDGSDSFEKVYSLGIEITDCCYSCNNNLFALVGLTYTPEGYIDITYAYTSVDGNYWEKIYEGSKSDSGSFYILASVFDFKGQICSLATTFSTVACLISLPSCTKLYKFSGYFSFSEITCTASGNDTVLWGGVHLPLFGEPLPRIASTNNLSETIDTELMTGKDTGTRFNSASYGNGLFVITDNKGNIWYQSSSTVYNI